MIKHNEPLSMVEAIDILKKSEIENPNLVGFVQKFISIKPKEAEELREELQKLDMLKIKPEHVAKIIDLLPENSEDLDKIFTDVGLDENESKKILEIIKKYK